MMERGYARCRFGQIHYVRGGPANAEAPPLILLHQTPSSIAELRPFARAMAVDRPVIAFDTPGFGMSDPPPAPVSMADYAMAFADALGELMPAKAEGLDLLGYHTGAYLAAELGIARHDLIGRVILAGIPFRPEAERTARLAAPATPPFGEAEALAFVEALWEFTVARRDPATPLERALELFADRIRAMERATWPYQGVWRYDAERRFALIAQPVLVLQPNDPLFAHWRTATACLARATVVEFPHLEKDVFDRGAEEFARAVRGWTGQEQVSKDTGRA